MFIPKGLIQVTLLFPPPPSPNLPGTLENAFSPCDLEHGRPGVPCHGDCGTLPLSKGGGGSGLFQQVSEDKK